MNQNLFSLTDYEQDGFVILRQFVPKELCSKIRGVAEALAKHPTPPCETEAELGYPGAPSITQAQGGNSIRRIKQLYMRDPIFELWVHYPPLVGALSAILGPEIYLTQVHHNSLMTKVPKFSSDTNWHQDLRYWSYKEGNLVTAWLALGDEYPQNGGMQLIPGSHNANLPTDKFDDEKFYFGNEDETSNNTVAATLNAGDLLLFHCKTLHSASRNKTDETKLSVVFTFRAASDTPISETRSSSLADIKIS